MSGLPYSLGEYPTSEAFDKHGQILAEPGNNDDIDLHHRLSLH